MTEQKTRTGLITAEVEISPIAIRDSSIDIAEFARKRIARELSCRIGELLARCHPLLIRTFPLIEGVRFRQSALVLLTNPEDAELGDFVIPDPFGDMSSIGEACSMGERFVWKTFERRAYSDPDRAEWVAYECVRIRKEHE